MTTDRFKIRYFIIVGFMLTSVGLSQKRTLAWGTKGHQIIARIARDRLSSRARNGTAGLLGRATLESVANWADSVRMYRNGHFVPIPLDSKGYDPDRDCKNECLIKAIENNVATLGNFDASRAKRAEALRYVVHLIGDLHQPLHCADNNDGGGSKLSVDFFGRATYLHSVWDDDIINRANMTVAAYSSQLSDGENGKGQSEGSYATGSLVDWALDSHRLARNAYRMNQDKKLAEDYYNENKRVIDRQLLKAGVRLAKVLNDVFQ